MNEKTIKDLCAEYGLGQSALARRFGIPLRTVQNWHAGVRIPPDYVVRMMDEILRTEKEKKYKLEKEGLIGAKGNMSKWIITDTGISTEFKCPVCGFEYVEGEPGLKKGCNYCPECGANNEQKRSDSLR